LLQLSGNGAVWFLTAREIHARSFAPLKSGYAQDDTATLMSATIESVPETKPFRLTESVKAAG